MSSEFGFKSQSRKPDQSPDPEVGSAENPSKIAVRRVLEDLAKTLDSQTDFGDGKLEVGRRGGWSAGRGPLEGSWSEGVTYAEVNVTESAIEVTTYGKYISQENRDQLKKALHSATGKPVRDVPPPPPKIFKISASDMGRDVPYDEDC